jgi:hypothetical protein
MPSAGLTWLRRRSGRFLQALIDAVRKRRRPEILRRLDEIEGLIAFQKWDDAVHLARETAAIARNANETGLLSNVGRLLEQLGEYDLASQTRFAADQKHHRHQGRRWDGEPIPGKTLLVEQVFEGMGQQLRYAFMAGVAARYAERCVVIAEPRLVPLLKRTFPKLQVLPRGTKDIPAFDYVTNYFDLYSMFGDSGAGIESMFRPLRPDPATVRKFTTRYQGKKKTPVIGISWATRSVERDFPRLDSWSGFLSGFEATFVSLQYGNVEQSLRELNRMADQPIIHDRSVDQLVNMDRFAAQVVSLDAVVTIDNTIAHTAGALGARTIVIPDDGVNHWPVRHERTPWCPNVIVIPRRQRGWKAVLAEARERTRALLVQSSDRSQTVHRPARPFQRKNRLRG